MNLFSTVDNIRRKVNAIWDVLVGEGAAFAKIVEDLEEIKATQKGHTALLLAILEAVTPLPASSIKFSVTLEGHTEEGATKVIIKDNQKFKLGVTIADPKGNPAAVENPTFTGFTGVLINDDPDAPGNPLMKEVVADGPLSQGQILFKADGDLGAGVQEISAFLDLQVVAQNASVVALVPGPAVDQ